MLEAAELLRSSWHTNVWFKIFREVDITKKRILFSGGTGKAGKNAVPIFWNWDTKY